MANIAQASVYSSAHGMQRTASKVGMATDLIRTVLQVVSALSGKPVATVGVTGAPTFKPGDPVKQGVSNPQPVSEESPTGPLSMGSYMSARPMVQGVQDLLTYKYMG